MTVLVVGLSHHSAPVTLLEHTAVSGDELTKLLCDVQQAPHVDEAMVVSTCNRVEVYAEVEKFHGGVSAITELLAQHSGVTLDQLTRHLYVHYEDRAVQHLFAVTCGLDSMVVGESQILGQVRTALRLAQEQDTVGRVLNEFVQQALRVGKRAHSETGIDQAGATLVSVGLDVARQHLGELDGRRAAVVGAGSMSALTAATLTRAGISGSDIVVANRTVERAEQVAESVGGHAISLAELADELPTIDIVVSCTGATGTVITAEAVAPAVRSRGSRALCFVDLALPRDVAPQVRELPGVSLVDLESLRGVDDEQARVADIETVRRIVTEEVAAYLSAVRAASVAPTVVALRTKAADVVDTELSRLTGRLPELEGADRDEIAQAMRRVVDKLLHAPTVRVKELADSPGGDSYAVALRELFDLDPKAPEAVARADVAVEEDQ